MVIPMIFMNPKTSFAFKRIFGSEQNKGILVSFLNAILYDGHFTIQDLTVLDSSQVPKIKGFRAHHLNVNAQLNSGDSIIIEIQLLNVEGKDQWALQNAIKADAIDPIVLEAGDQKRALSPIVGLTIADFEMIEGNLSPISRVVLDQNNSLMDNPTSNLELVFVELPKLKKSLSELTTLGDKWIYFMYHARKLSNVPDTLGQVPEIQRAFELANEGMLMPEELDELEHQQMFIYDQRGVLVYGVRVGLEKMMQEAVEKSPDDIQRSFAQNLLAIFGNRMISQITGLSLEDVESLRSPD